jgi:hypothetical protein
MLAMYVYIISERKKKMVYFSQVQIWLPKRPFQKYWVCNCFEPVQVDLIGFFPAAVINFTVTVHGVQSKLSGAQTQCTWETTTVSYRFKSSNWSFTQNFDKKNLAYDRRWGPPSGGRCIHPSGRGTNRTSVPSCRLAAKIWRERK